MIRCVGNTMGIIWRLEMVTLSTLAALVIFAHSAEENFDTDPRFELRPRLLDTGTPSQDQPWRAVDELLPQQPAPSQVWPDTPGEAPKRRRPVRKRKRRPLEEGRQDPPLQERQQYAEDHPRYYAGDNPTTNAPLRRKKSENNRWSNDFIETHRPLRRHSPRRKRPVEEWPTLREINEYKEENVKVTTYQPETAVEEEGERRPVKEWLLERNEAPVSNPDNNKKALQDDTEFPVPEDKSLSDFSMEILYPDPNKRKMRIKSPTVDADHVDLKTRKPGPIDPVTLKDILKQSNGSSLSEILQEHNLSLADLLHGKEDAISVLKSQNPDNTMMSQNYEETKIANPKIEKQQETAMEKLESKANIGEKSVDTIIETKDLPVPTSTEKSENETFINLDPLVLNVTAPQRVLKKHGNIRRRQRIRPMNITRPVNRELMALTARKYSQSNYRNNTKLKELKRSVLLMLNASDIFKNMSGSTEKLKKQVAELTTPPTIQEDTTTARNSILNNSVFIDTQTEVNIDQTESGTVLFTEETTESTFTTELDETVTETPTTTTEKPRSKNRQSADRVGLRRQAFNNRLKKKRLKQKISTTSAPNEHENNMEDFFGIPNLVSSSEFIARTQPSPTPTEMGDQFTDLDDFITTEPAMHSTNTLITSSSTPNSQITSTTEETAKIEIEEFLNDTRTSGRLWKILMERNMTLNELVELRERGSSHIHLADIFHNASKEPNPLEPFLSKSLLEPISKETYPLRAILEANLHDPKAKTTTSDASQAQSMNIPVIMDFGNNVNENGENMGIMSLFNKFSGETNLENSSIDRDSKGTPYVSTVISVNNTNSSDNAREGRTIEPKEEKSEIMTWNELFAMMRKSQQNDSDTAAIIPGLGNLGTLTFEEDKDGDGLIVLEDLQHLNDFESHIASASDEKLEINTFESTDVPKRDSGLESHMASNTRSVTVATASIVGLTMILFLLTYAIIKWKQQRNMLSKKQSFRDDHIPTPVFEHRKSHKNCSSRSMSPMLATSNIYTMNTLEVHNSGKESPEYAWDSLRKPFQ